MTPPEHPSERPSKPRRRPSVEIIALGVGLIVWALAYNFDLFERFYQFSRQHDEWQLDELLMVLAVTTILLVVVTVVRLRELRLQIGQRQQAETTLAASQRRFQALIEHSAEGIALVTPDGSVRYTSPSVAHILGGTAAYWDSGNFFARVHPDDRLPLTRLWEQLLANPQVSVTILFRYRHFDETWRWLELTGTNWLAAPAVQGVVVNFRDVTQREQIGVALAQAERRYRTMVEQIPAIVYMAALDEAGTPLYISPQISKLGYTPAEYAADTDLWARHLHPDDRARVVAEFARMRATGVTAVSEYRVLHPAGHEIWLRDESVIVRDAAGQSLFQQGLLLDITARKQAEAALAASEGRFKALLEHSAEGITLIAADGTIQYTSPTAQLILGASADYWIGGSFFTRLHPDDAAPVQQLWEQLLAQPQVSVTAQFRYRHFDDSWRWLEVTGTNWLADQAVQAVVVNYRDVTERQQAIEVLQQAETKYRTMVEQIPAILYMAALDAAGTSLYNSPQIAMLGHTPAEYAADPDLWSRSIHPDDRPRVLAETDAMRTTGQSFISEYRVLHPDGRTIWLQDEAVIVKDAAGQPQFQQGVVVDITARKQAEAALAAREQRFQALIEHAPDAISLLAADGYATYASPSTLRILGYDPARMVGSDPAALTHPDDLPGLLAQLADLGGRPGETITTQYRFRHQDGRWCWLESNITNLLHEPSVAAFVFNFRDVTERRQHDRELAALVGVAAALRLAPSRALMLTAVLNQVLSALGLAGAALAFRDPATDEVEIEMSLGQWAADTGHRLPAGEGISGLVIATGQPYVTRDAGVDPRFSARQQLRGVRAVACVPLIAQHDILGTLWVAREQEFADGDVRLLTAMAEIAASAIQRVTLLEIAQQGIERLTALRTIERAISNSLDLRLTLHILLEQILSVLRVDAAVVLLLNADTHVLSVAASRGLTAAGRALPELRLGQGRAGRVALERQRLEVLDLAADAAGGPPPQGENFRAYVGLPLISKGEVQGVLEIYQRTPLAPTHDWRVFLEALAGQAAIAIDNAQLFTGLQDSNLQLTLAYDATIEGWSAALDLRDQETEGHSQRVTELTLTLAQAMGMSAEELVHVRRGALLHDIGKMAVPDHILRKPGPLSDEEWVRMRGHPRSAYELLARINYLRPALDIPYAHHEKWDGTGYPRGLKGLQIPLAARLFAVADVWDALCSDRVYRPGWPKDKVRQYMRAESGKHFDPAVVEEFLRLESAGQPALDAPSFA